MKEIVKSLEERLKYLERLKERVEKSLENAPEGILKISKCKNLTQYYLRKDKKDCSGKYLDKENRALAYKLAQKEYDVQVLKVVEKQKRNLYDEDSL